MLPISQRWSPAPLSPTTARFLWSTEDELLFVTSLGAWHTPQRERAPLLRRYLAALSQRQNWGQIDVVQVRLQVERLLAEEPPASVC